MLLPLVRFQVYAIPLTHHIDFSKLLEGSTTVSYVDAEMTIHTAILNVSSFSVTLL